MNTCKYTTSHAPFALLLALFFAAQTALAQTGTPIKVQVKNEQAVNTAGLEFSPTFYEDGIVFISTTMLV